MPEGTMRQTETPTRFVLVRQRLKALLKTLSFLVMNKLKWFPLNCSNYVSKIQIVLLPQNDSSQRQQNTLELLIDEETNMRQ